MFQYAWSRFYGKKQNKPNRTAYLNLQGGAELEYYFVNEFFGGIYFAINVSLYQLIAFAPKKSFPGAYMLPSDRNKKRMRFAFNYYNGGSLSNQFCCEF